MVCLEHLPRRVHKKGAKPTIGIARKDCGIARSIKKQSKNTAIKPSIRRMISHDLDQSRYNQDQRVQVFDG